MKKNIFKYIVTPIIAGIIGSLLLVLVSFIPQSAIQKNAEISAEQLCADGIYPKYINIWDISYRFDQQTDTLIMMGAYNLDDAKDALINPYRKAQNADEYTMDAFRKVVTEGAENDMVYVRYWQGFRILLRPLLLLLPYFEIRHIVSWVFFGLLFAMLAALAERKGVGTAICIGASIILVNPSIISHSLQFTPCFILSFIYVLFLIFTENKRYDRALAFCLFGILTQYFDFYTVPVLTCGLPLIVLLILDDDFAKGIKTVAKSFAAWAYGYISMWLVKLVMVPLFTDVNGISDGLGAFSKRIGIEKEVGLEAAYSPVDALLAVWDMITPGATGAFFLIVTFLIVTVSALVIWKKQGFKTLMQTSVLLVVAALPIIWHICAAQPTVIHAFFQYRDMAVFFAGVFLFALKATPLWDKYLIKNNIK